MQDATSRDSGAEGNAPCRHVSERCRRLQAPELRHVLSDRSVGNPKRAATGAQQPRRAGASPRWEGGLAGRDGHALGPWPPRAQ